MTDDLFAKAAAVLGAVAVLDTMADIKAIMALTKKAAALKAIESMEARLVERMVHDGIDATGATKHAALIAQRVRGAWIMLHLSVSKA